MPDRAEVDRLIAYHGTVSQAMTAERTALESALIPVSAYILVSAVECWYRHPEMVSVIDTAMPAVEIGRRGRQPGMRVNAVHLWSQANIYLTGRKLLTALHGFGLVPDFVDDPAPTWTVLDFWQRAAAGYRDDGHLQAWDAGLVNRPYGDDIVADLLAGTTPVAGEDERNRIGRFLATLYNYLFLLYFDTRVGTGDTGPYPLPDGRTLLVRDFYWLSESEFPWSSVARDVPYHNLTAALVLGDGVQFGCNDWGTTIARPEDYLPHLQAFGLFTTDTPDRSLRPVDPGELDELVAVVRKAQAAHYRNVAAMSHNEKIEAGAYVYFSFLKPFADVAGVGDKLDWRVPQASTGPIYDMLSTIDLTSLPADDPNAPYYAPLAPLVAS